MEYWFTYTNGRVNFQNLEMTSSFPHLGTGKLSFQNQLCGYHRHKKKERKERKEKSCSHHPLCDAASQMYTVEK